MLRLLKRYASWLHLRWPAGRVEPLPEIGKDGSTRVPGLYVTGDLTGIPLLKFAADSGARTIRAILEDPSFRTRSRHGEPGKSPLDLVIVGGGVSGMSAALEASRAGLDFQVIEASRPFSTIANFPRAKPIYTYPTGMTPTGDLRFTEKSAIKEGLLEELTLQAEAHGISPRIGRVDAVVRKQGLLEVRLAEGEVVRAHRVIIAIGRSGDFRRLDVPGEDLDKVFNRLHDPKDYSDKDVLVVGGGDSALETVVAIAEKGGRVTLSYRSQKLSRPGEDNLEALKHLEGRVEILTGSRVREIGEGHVVLEEAGGQVRSLPNDVVFTMIGREPPLDFLRRCGVRIRGEWRVSTWAGFLAFMILCTFLYNWKAGGALTSLFDEKGWFPFNFRSLATAASDPSTLIGTLRISIIEPGFWFSLAYTLIVVIFGIRRIRRRRTPYVTWQTVTLTLIQVIPLFLLPFILLPWAGNNGWFDEGIMRSVGDALFPEAEWAAQGREYWRSVGFILAWPLFVWNVFSWEPMWTWLGISLFQTFVLIPLMIYFWGKGSYCGWICSCGALAETLGDTHRHKMPHGPASNRLNMTGQVILLLAFVLLVARVISWALPTGTFGDSAYYLYEGMLRGWVVWGVQLNYQWVVDLFLAGIVGYGTYFWFSGRVWCRFACPLAALMHIYARFSRFRILSEKSKCISCNVCTSVCHQGIDVMNFANKGEPMADPECVRCSACVEGCPTGTLSFGQVDRSTGQILQKDRLVASPVLAAEEKRDSS